jgi:hypothetical protein
VTVSDLAADVRDAGQCLVVNIVGPGVSGTLAMQCNGPVRMDGFG